MGWAGSPEAYAPITTNEENPQGLENLDFDNVDWESLTWSDFDKLADSHNTHGSAAPITPATNPVLDFNFASNDRSVPDPLDHLENFMMDHQANLARANGYPPNYGINPRLIYNPDATTDPTNPLLFNDDFFANPMNLFESGPMEDMNFNSMVSQPSPLVTNPNSHLKTEHDPLLVTPDTAASFEMLAPTKPTDSAPPAKKRCRRQASKKTPAKQPPESSSAKLTTGLPTPESTKSDSPAKKRGADAEAESDPLPDPKEVLGMTWQDVMQMQLRGEGASSTMFSSLEEANQTLYDRSPSVEVDDTIPTNLADKKVLVSLIVKVMKDVSAVQPTEKFVAPWAKGRYPEMQVERGAWELLECLILSQTSETKVVGANKNKGCYPKFADRFLEALACLKRSKSTARNVVSPTNTANLANNPFEVRKACRSNKKLNINKKFQIDQGKAAIAAKRKAAAIEEEEDEEDEDEESELSSPPTPTPTSRAGTKRRADANDAAVETRENARKKRRRS